MVDVLGMPVLTGHKTPRERFAGAIQTWTCEGMMGDGKALQMGTSHELGQNFAVPFNITFSNASGDLEHVWQTSWGVSTRLVGALVMGHGDDFGLRLPPALAPAQVVVLMVKDAPEVGQAAGALVAELTAAGHRVRLDDRTDTSFGRRSVDWELKGVPGPGRGRTPGPGRGKRDPGHPAPPREGERAPGGRGRPGGRGAGRGGRRAPGRGDRGPGRPHGGRRHAWRRRSRRPAWASPASPWGFSVPMVRTAWPSMPSPCAACSAPTARWPCLETPTTDLMAVVARSY